MTSELTIEIIWTWCPICGTRQDHLKLEDGSVRCLECQTLTDLHKELHASL